MKKIRNVTVSTQTVLTPVAIDAGSACSGRRFTAPPPPPPDERPYSIRIPPCSYCESRANLMELPYIKFAVSSVQKSTHLIDERPELDTIIAV
jgi:hypothetical protein